MAKHTTLAAEKTPDLLGGSKRRGRPRSEHPMTPAQRQAAYRQRQAEELNEIAEAFANLSNEELAERAAKGGIRAWQILGKRIGALK